MFQLTAVQTTGNQPHSSRSSADRAFWNPIRTCREKTSRVIPSRTYVRSMQGNYAFTFQGISDLLLFRLATRQCAAACMWASTLSNQNIPERRNPRIKKEPCAQGLSTYCVPTSYWIKQNNSNRYPWSPSRRYFLWEKCNIFDRHPPKTNPKSTRNYPGIPWSGGEWHPHAHHASTGMPKHHHQSFIIINVGRLLLQLSCSTSSCSLGTDREPCTYICFTFGGAVCKKSNTSSSGHPYLFVGFPLINSPYILHNNNNRLPAALRCTLLPFFTTCRGMPWHPPAANPSTASSTAYHRISHGPPRDTMEPSPKPQTHPWCRGHRSSWPFWGALGVAMTCRWVTTECRVGCRGDCLRATHGMPRHPPRRAMKSYATPWDGVRMGTMICHGWYHVAMSRKIY